MGVVWAEAVQTASC